MGSLMAGWDSPTLDPKLEKLKRNRSLTKEDIAAYWRTKKEIEEEHLRALPNLSETTDQGSKYEKMETWKKSSKVSLTRRAKDSLDTDDETSLKQHISKNDWWTKSSWAFLNEPPEMEAASNNYASQFHVANLGSSKFNPGDGISA